MLHEQLETTLNMLALLLGGLGLSSATVWSASFRSVGGVDNADLTCAGACSRRSDCNGFRSPPGGSTEPQSAAGCQLLLHTIDAGEHDFWLLLKAPGSTTTSSTSPTTVTIATAATAAEVTSTSPTAAGTAEAEGTTATTAVTTPATTAIATSSSTVGMVSTESTAGTTRSATATTAAARTTTALATLTTPNPATATVDTILTTTAAAEATAVPTAMCTAATTTTTLATLSTTAGRPTTTTVTATTVVAAVSAATTATTTVATMTTTTTTSTTVLTTPLATAISPTLWIQGESPPACPGGSLGVSVATAEEIALENGRHLLLQVTGDRMMLTRLQADYQLCRSGATLPVRSVFQVPSGGGPEYDGCMVTTCSLADQGGSRIVSKDKGNAVCYCSSLTLSPAGELSCQLSRISGQYSCDASFLLLDTQLREVFGVHAPAVSPTRYHIWVNGGPYVNTPNVDVRLQNHIQELLSKIAELYGPITAIATLWRPEGNPDTMLGCAVFVDDLYLVDEFTWPAEQVPSLEDSLKGPFRHCDNISMC